MRVCDVLDHPDFEPGGHPVPSLMVRLHRRHAEDIDRRSLDALVEYGQPAHIRIACRGGCRIYGPDRRGWWPVHNAVDRLGSVGVSESVSLP